MTFERIRYLKDTDEGKEYTIPGDAVFIPDVCYLDGSPVLITRERPAIIKIGKHKFMKVILK